MARRFGHGTDRPARARRYTTDATDAEWQQIAPLLPWPAWLGGAGGHPEMYCRRTVIDAICYVALLTELIRLFQQVDKGIGLLA
ncbi:transposase [Nocardia sp. NPDC051570]|uniref:transposase n=1 Tax=Nocardia sp. NPDC051570 TaxID=3364324 RepID=UPI003789CA60